MKMDHDNLRKSSAMASFLTNKTKTREKQNHQKAAEWDEWPRDLPNHWKASPMMKNQTAKIKKVKSWS